jgi:hypothetical protein
MHTCEMRFPGFDARGNRGLIRWELFLHPDIRDVLPTPREDTLCVVFRGEPDLGRWADTLTTAGFPHPLFDDAMGDPLVDGLGDAAA